MSTFAVDALWQALSGIFSWKILVAAAEFSWFLVYFLMIREAYRTKSCGQPLLGMCAVLVQCFIYATFGPYWRPDLFPHNPYAGGSFGVVWVWRLWFVVQAFGLYQFFKYHKPATSRYDVPVTAANLTAVVAVIIGLNLFAQWTFITYFNDINVNSSDPMAYMFLAVGFVLLALSRPGHEGLSYPAAWLKLFATAIIYASTFVHPAVSYGSIITAPTAGLDGIVAGQGRPLSNQDTEEAIQFEMEKWDAHARNEVCMNSAANPLENCTILTWTCGPSYTVTATPSGPPDCPPTIARLLDSKPGLYLRGWRLSGPDSVFSTAWGKWDLIRTSAENDAAASHPASWTTVFTCLVRSRVEVAASWKPEPIPIDSVVSCVDGIVRVQYAFPLFMSIACVGFDALYVGILWRGRRRRKAAALAGVVGA